MRFLIAAIFAVFAGPSLAQMTDENQFIWDNLMGTFYHELAHAVIHQYEVPMYGQEEDAADVFAAYLISKWHKPAEGRRIARAVALAFYADFHDYEDSGADVRWHGVHGPALQRMYNHVCIFAGSNLSRHYDFGQALGLDEDRLEYC
ncbi:MAG: DUF4344 domain-containing metallopeptidase, partial [Pseudomonadota bacterium]